AYAVPLLVQSDAPRALPLFGYLTFVTAASLAVLRHRAWWWLAWLALAGAVFWTLLALGSVEGHPQRLLAGGFLLILLMLFGTFRRGIAGIAFLAGTADAPIVTVLVRSAFWVIAAVMIVFVHVDGFATSSLAVAFLAASFFLWFGYKDA